VKFTRRTSITILISGTLLVLACVAARRFQQRAWERFLISFRGEPFVGELEGSPASSLQLSDGHSVLIYERGTNHPILVMRSPTQSNLWKQALVPENVVADGSVRRGVIHDIDFKFAQPYRGGVKVFVSCDWFWGGHEAGIIYIGPRHVFEGFALSW
jgi:hypothetical protein